MYEVQITYLIEVEASSPMEAVKMVENKEIIIDRSDLYSVSAVEVKHDRKITRRNANDQHKG